MARTQPPVNVWVQSVSRGNRKSCPTCKARLEPGESIWNFGEYVRGKWNSWNIDFCKACFDPEATERLLAPHVHARGWEFCPRSGSSLPAWLRKKEPPEEDTFWAAVDAEPEDDLPKLVFADWLDERGDPRGDCLRWAVSVQLRPTVNSEPCWNGYILPVSLFDAVMRKYVPWPDRRTAAPWRRLCDGWQLLADEGLDPLTGEPLWQSPSSEKSSSPTPTS